MAMRQGQVDPGITAVERRQVDSVIMAPRGLNSKSGFPTM